MFSCQRMFCCKVVTVNEAHNITINIDVCSTTYIACYTAFAILSVSGVVAKERHLLSCRNINRFACIWCYRLRSISANPVCCVARSFILKSNRATGNRLKCQWSRINVRINRFFAFFTRVGVRIFISSSCIIRYCPSIWNT